MGRPARGQKQCHCLSISPPTCLDRHDLHVSFSDRAQGKGGVGGNSHLHGALGVAALGTGQDSAQVTRLTSGHKITLCSNTPTNTGFLFFHNHTEVM